MYLKRLVLFATFICLAFAFSLSAYAMPEEEGDGFFDTFVIDQDELHKNTVDSNLGLYVVGQDGASTIQKEDADINDFNFFSLNKGFSKLSVVTFADTKILSGKGDEKTVVGVMVFNISKDNKIASAFESIETIGASGVYNATVNLKKGENNVIIVVKNADKMIYRLYKVTVKEEETKGKLENIQVDFIPTEKGTTEQKPSAIKPFIPYNLPK